jgi:hypothetical protein
VPIIILPLLANRFYFEAEYNPPTLFVDIHQSPVKFALHTNVVNRPSEIVCCPLECIMSFVDRSNTNWTPWPRLSGIPPRLQVIGGIVTIFAAAGVLHTISRKSGPPLPKTLSKEWKDATVKSYEAKEREAAGPVVLNPITRSRET